MRAEIKSLTQRNPINSNDAIHSNDDWCGNGVHGGSPIQLGSILDDSVLYRNSILTGAWGTNVLQLCLQSLMLQWFPPDGDGLLLE